MSRRSIRDSRIEDWLLSSYDPAPISEANRWLITGPDTMPYELREKCHWLVYFHRFTREGTIEHTRESWLAIPPHERFIPLLKGLYHPSKLEALHVGNPYFELLPKIPDFYGAPVVHLG